MVKDLLGGVGADDLSMGITGDEGVRDEKEGEEEAWMILKEVSAAGVFRGGRTLPGGRPLTGEKVIARIDK